MREWDLLSINSTTREVIEKFNKNANSSRFMDYVTGTIMNNGLLFTDTETIEGELINPLTPVPLSGIVNSNTIFDNFRMYFRESNSIVELDQFPVDLTMYNDAKPHFLYFKEDRTYRVSDYIFGQTNEVLICRFLINKDKTWGHMYIMAQRAGTPAYNSGEEFYSLDGINVKSPGGLRLSHTDGIVKRSGIEFTDKFSPDLYRNFNSSNTPLPIRYTNLSNEVDYTLDTVENVDPNHYMTYDSNSKKRNAASERIRNIYNMIYGVDEFAAQAAKALSDSITAGSGQSEYRRILDIFVAHMNSIYALIGEFGDFISDSYFDFLETTRTKLATNISTYTNFSNTHFGDSVTITYDTVDAIRNSVYYLISGNDIICNNPIEDILSDAYSDINSSVVNEGELKDVPEGKFTLQRVLWDIYEDTLIVQYGDTVYDTVEDAAAKIGSMLYPVPFGRLMYIPLAVLVIHQGTTDLATDPESVILMKQYIYADSEQEGFADYIARALANRGLTYISQIIDGTLPVGKAETLARDNNGVTVYETGDYYLNYDNLKNAVKVINTLAEDAYDPKKALSAHQGYVLDGKKLNRDGSNSITGILKPDANGTRDLGTSSLRFKTVYSSGMNSNGNIVPAVNSNGTTGYDLGSSTAYWKTIYAKAISGLTSLSATTITGTNITASGTLQGATGKITGNATVGGTLRVTGKTTLATLQTTGNSSLGGTVTITNPLIIGNGNRKYVMSGLNANTASTVDYLEAAQGKTSSNIGGYNDKSIIVSW